MSETAKSRVLVIGGTKGAGLLIARLLHERGFHVRVLARDPASATAELGASFEVIAGDLTKADTLAPAVAQVDHIIFTAGAPSGRYAPESLVKATDYQGVADTLAAARQAGLAGRFVYLTRLASRRLPWQAPCSTSSRGTRSSGAGASKKTFVPAAWTIGSYASASCSTAPAASTPLLWVRTPSRWRLATGLPAPMSRRRSSRRCSIPARRA